MGLLGSVLDLDKTLNGILGGGSGGSSGLLSPVTNLVANLTNIGGGSGTSGGVENLLDLELLNDKGVVQLTLLGKDIVVLPNNGGIIETDLLSDGDILGGLTGGITNIIELDGLLSDAGLLNLTGLLGDNGILSLDGILGEVLELLGVILTPRDPNDPLDPDAPVDPNDFENQLIGTSAKDTFTMPQSSTYVDGRGNIDTANFARSAEGLSFAVSKDAVLFAEGEDIYYLRDVERINFFEGTLLLDTGAGENAGMAYRLYQAAFDRIPDAPGLEYWIGRLDSGNVSLAAIADSFIHSPEFIRTFGTKETVSNEKFVELLYTHTLGRDFDQSGLDYWVERLDNNMTNRGDILAFFSESEENQARVAEAIDNGIWLA